MHKKSEVVKTFLLDGIPDGVRTTEIMLSTIHSIAFKRDLFPRVKSEFKSELDRPGIYILLSDTTVDEKIGYIGETECLIERLAYHHSNKDAKNFWYETIVFSSKDDNLTKAHVRYVEAELIKLAKTNPTWHMAENKKAPSSGGILPLSDRKTMNKLIEQIRIITGTVGCDIFKEKSPIRSIAIAKGETTEVSPLFEMKGDGYQASAVISFPSLEFIVKAGSRARTNTNDSLRPGGKKLREELITNGTLTHTADGYVFATDWSFSSPSSAAGIISGSPTSGRTSWKTEDKTTYADYLALKDGGPSAALATGKSMGNV